MGVDEWGSQRFTPPRPHRHLVGRRTLEDLGSKNGTLLKSQRVAGKAALADLDEIQIGSARIVMRIMRGGEPTQTRDA